MGSKPSSTASAHTHKQKKLPCSQHNLKSQRVLKPIKSSDDSHQFIQLRCEQLFQQYADPDSPDRITPDGTQRFFQDLGLSIEDPMIFIVAWKMQAASIGYISKEEWMTGLGGLGADSLEKIRSNQPTFKKVLEDPVEFKEMYKYTFNYIKNKDQKCLEVETASVVWSMLLESKYPIVHTFNQFLQEKKPVKVINRDQWNSFLEFVWTDIDDYDESSACKCRFFFD